MRRAPAPSRLLGAKAAGLLMNRSNKFELVVNLAVAQALGLTVPSDLLSIADEVTNNPQFCCGAYSRCWPELPVRRSAAVRQL